MRVAVFEVRIPFEGEESNVVQRLAFALNAAQIRGTVIHKHTEQTGPHETAAASYPKPGVDVAPARVVIDEDPIDRDRFMQWDRTPSSTPAEDIEAAVRRINEGPKPHGVRAVFVRRPTTAEVAAVLGTDPRVAYGATCTWWDSVERVAVEGDERLPVCPHCRGPLFEAPNLGEFMQGSREHEAAGAFGYVAFLNWTRGKCHPSADEAEKAWRKTLDVQPPPWPREA